MTSNIGAKYICDNKHLGFFEQKQDEYLEIKKEVLNQVKKEFKPEFLNRIDEIIIFNKLSDKEIYKIFDILIKKVEQRLKQKNINIEISEEAKKFIINKENISQYGARPLKRAIQKYVEDLITDAILDGKLTENKKANIKLINNKLVVET